MVQHTEADDQEKDARDAKSDPSEVTKENALSRPLRRKIAGAGRARVFQLLRDSWKWLSAQELSHGNLQILASYATKTRPTS